MQQGDDAVTPELLARIASLLPEIAWTSTIPIMVMYDGKLGLLGTGSLFRIADAHFLVTAAHVLERANEHKAPILVGSTGYTHPLQIGGGSFKAADDSLDVAIWRLSEKTVGCLNNNTFLCLQDVLALDRFDDDNYFVCGFPCEHSTVAATETEVAQAAPLEFCTTLFHGDTSDAPGYSPAHHILLSADRKFLYKGRGPDRSLPDSFGGLSGCSIWKANASGRAQELWKPGQAKLVAVQTCAYPPRKTHKMLRGTAWREVGGLIGAVFPELKPSFGLYYR